MIKIQLNNRIRLILIVICLIIFAFSGFKIIFKLMSYSRENKQYEALRDMTHREQPLIDGVVSPSPISTDPEGASEQKPLPIPYKVLSGDAAQLNAEGILKDYEKLKAQNPDLTAWVYIPGYKKPIDYPVMKAENNDYYLNRDFYKNNSYAGSIFIDAANQTNDVDRHIILYGHAMRDMSMFGNLADYADKEEEYTSINRVYLDLMNTRLEYEIFSAYYEESSYNYRQMDFTSDDDYQDFLDRIRSKSLHDFGVTLTPQDKIITLSTCKSDYGKDGRTIIHAKLSCQVRYDGTDDITLVSNDNGKKIISANTYLEKLTLQYNIADIQPIQDPASDEQKDEGRTNAPASEGPEPSSTGKPASETPPPAVSPKASTPPAPATTPLPASVPNVTTTAIAGDLVEAILEPSFWSTVKEYTTTVPAGLSKIIINSVSADPKAKLTITVNEANVTSSAIALAQEETTVKIKVTSQDGLYAFAYTIKIRWDSFKEELPSVSED